MEGKLDWSILGDYNMTPEEEAQRAKQDIENSALAEIRADYHWIKECEILPLAKLREIIATGPYVPKEDGSQPNPEDVSEPFRTLHLKRHRQAVIVLEARETGYDPLAPKIC